MEAFNMNYGWEFHHIMNEVANGRQGKEQIKAYLEKNDTLYSQDDIRMYFTTNHDENSWNGTVFERMGPQHLNMFVLGATLPGMPLIYSGQEAGLDRRLSFLARTALTGPMTSMCLLPPDAWAETRSESPLERQMGRIIGVDRYFRPRPFVLQAEAGRQRGMGAVESVQRTQYFHC